MALVQEIAQTIREILVDSDADIYSDNLIYNGIYSAEIVIANNRLDSTATYEPFTCVAGTRQSITNGQAIISVEKNTTSKKSIRIVSKQDLDSFDVDWHLQPESDAQEYALDDREATVFYVNPPVPAGHLLDVSYSAIPARYGVVSGTTETTVKDNFVQAIIEFALYFCFSTDTEGTPNISRSDRHLITFSQMLGLNWQTIKGQSAKNMDNKR